jgi:hypothetical protein
MASGHRRACRRDTVPRCTGALSCIGVRALPDTTRSEAAREPKRLGARVVACRAPTPARARPCLRQPSS